MASITFTAFVESWTKNAEQHPAWGMKTAETHRKKDGDEWVDNGRTFRTVKVAYGVDLDLTQFRKGDRVNIVGTEVTESREHDGKKYYDLVVKATSVELAQTGRQQQQPAAPVSRPVNDWEPDAFAPTSTVPADMPF
ncbi:hypothetical protein [Rathayibacter sp. VKM Ac-2630]|uniref:hypothetical protein n=1 Tax=Rathayibacter sp. VKM Ac-2630 TaxID=1938617 RepID=UPI000981FAC3|nr:hypothetical protein [Rathayibacter sp. VKM Ac-2630]OOB91206.1 hypothetical protein B0T42_07355 [Rathayibacter sp. VKM Ac-2630]